MSLFENTTHTIVKRTLFNNKVFWDDFVQNYNNRQNKELACFTRIKLMKTINKLKACQELKEFVRVLFCVQIDFLLIYVQKNSKKRKDKLEDSAFSHGRC